MVRSVAFRPPLGQEFATVSHKKLQVWDARTGKRRFQKEADPEFVNCVAFRGDGKYLATVGYTGTAKVWDVEKQKVVCSFNKHHTSVFCVAFHPKEGYLASGGSDFQVKLWAPDPPAGREICKLTGHTDYVFGAAFSPEGKYLATTSWREVIVWDVNDLEKIKRLRTFDRLAGRIHCMAFSPDGKRLAAASGYKGKGEITIWDASCWEN
jgi:WD40 repeat protein